MFSEEIRNLIVEVIKSWQVLTVTVVLILYFFLVNYVSRLRRRKRPPLPMPGEKKAKPAVIEPSDDDDLGLEEKKKEGTT